LWQSPQTLAPWWFIGKKVWFQLAGVHPFVVWQVWQVVGKPAA
jgi:hypothetical protein